MEHFMLLTTQAWVQRLQERLRHGAHTWSFFICAALRSPPLLAAAAIMSSPTRCSNLDLQHENVLRHICTPAPHNISRHCGHGHAPSHGAIVRETSTEAGA